MTKKQKGRPTLTQDPNDPTVRKSLSLPRSLVDDVQAFADRYGMTWAAVARQSIMGAMSPKTRAI